jgi:pilus assembly protein Flp/PilA
MKKLLAFREAYLRDENGATAIEYGLIAAGISLAIVTIVFTFGQDLNTLFTTMSGKLAGANADAGADGG